MKLPRLSSQICLGLFALIFLSSFFLKATPGGFWSTYAVASLFALLPLVKGPRWYRIAAIVGLVAAAILAFSDFQAGKKYAEQRRLELQSQADAARPDNRAALLEAVFNDEQWAPFLEHFKHERLKVAWDNQLYALTETNGIQRVSKTDSDAAGLANAKLVVTAAVLSEKKDG